MQRIIRFDDVRKKKQKNKIQIERKILMMHTEYS